MNERNKVKGNWTIKSQYNKGGSFRIMNNGWVIPYILVCAAMQTKTGMTKIFKDIYCTNNALDSKEAQLQPYMVYRIGLLSW